MRSCTLSSTQYTIATAAENKRLLISLSGDQDVDLYVRYNTAIVVQSGQVVVDYNSDGAESQEEVSITANVLPPLQAGTYYIAMVNCGASAANFTLTATTTNGGGQLTEELKTDDSSADDAFAITSGIIGTPKIEPR